MINVKLINPSLNLSKIVNRYQKDITLIHKKIINKTDYQDYLGWLDWHKSNLYEKQVEAIQKIQQKWNKLKINKIVVIGIGGSYISVKAAIDMCAEKTAVEKFIFASEIDENAIKTNINSLMKENWAIIVISKSGKTLESSINFRFYREAIKKKYKKNHHERIVCVTDSSDGLLHEIAVKHQYQQLIIPNDIGGRFSTFTPVGLLVFKLAGLDIQKLIKGWSEYIDEFSSYQNNSAMTYAAIRFYLLKRKQKNVEVFATYCNQTHFIAQHYKQIFAESEGKNKNCLIPTIANYSNDLHSIGQLYQEGPNTFFETHLTIKKHPNSLKIVDSSFKNDDALNNLSKKTIFDVQSAIQTSVIRAHVSANRICLEIQLDQIDEFHFGQLIAFLDLSATCSAYFLKVHPFNQPGVESYKTELKNIIK